MTTIPTEETTIPTEETTTPTEEGATLEEENAAPTDKKSSKSVLIAGIVILGLLILAAGTGAIIYYINKKKDDDNIPIVEDVPVYVIDQETGAVAPDIIWPECEGQIFVNETAKELYSIDVRIYDKYNYGPIHLELYDKIFGSLIAKSSSESGEGWTTFDFATRPILKVPNYTYSFIVVPDDYQDVAIWYNDEAHLESGKEVLYNYMTKEVLEGPAGSSLTYKLYATQYD